MSSTIEPSVGAPIPQRGITWRNWSGQQACQPREYFTPASEDELAHIVAQSHGCMRVTGAGHSFSAVVPTGDVLISLDELSGLASVDAALQQATLGAGTRIHDLGGPLFDRGLGLLNQGDVDAQSLGGAFSTGTHGTGRQLGCLASALMAFRLVTAEGEVLTCDSRNNAPLFHAGAVSLGALGVMSQVTVQCRPAYKLRERVIAMPWRECLEAAEQLAAENRHFEFFHFPYAQQVLVKTLNETDAAAFGSSRGEEREDRLFRWACESVRWLPQLNATLQRIMLALYKPRERADRSYRIFPSRRTARFHEMEYEVPAEAGVRCFREIVEEIRRRQLPVLFPVEFRRVARDELWLSPFYQRDSVSISVHQYQRCAYQEIFRSLEPIFWQYDARPHWGKLHSLTAEQLAALYPRWLEFKALRRQLDPQGKFLNPYLRQLLGD